MRNKIIIIALIIYSFSLLSAVIPFIEDYFYPKVIIVCFEKEAIGNRQGDLDFRIEDGIVKTGLAEFDHLAETYRFVDLERFIKSVKYLDWNDDGVFIQNIYRLRLENNDRIEEAVSALNSNPDIIYAEYETIDRTGFIPNDPLYSVQWHLPQIEAPLAWDYTFGSEEVIIGIVDQGVKWNHPDLRDNIWINQPELDAGMTINWANGTISGGNNVDDDGNGKIDDVIGYNFYGSDNNDSYQDYAANDHGTHVAGCAGAVGNNNEGVAGSALNISILGTRHSSQYSPSDGVQDGYSGIIYCADTGADIINCSWGGPGSGAYPNNIINYATNHGALVVAAAGNDALEHTDFYQDYPADCDNALCVAATDQMDVITYFSDYGEPIDVSAPGINIRSTINQDDGYDSYQGTSMASPITAGIAGLVKSIHPTISPLDLRSRMMMTCDYIDDLNPGYEGLLGSGRVNAFTATMYDLIPRLTIEAQNLEENDGDGDGVPNPGEILDFTIMVQNGYFTAGFWATATGVTATLSCELESVDILQGTSTFPDISGGVSLWNNNSPFQIQTPENSNIYDIPLTVTITSNQDSEYPYEVSYDIMARLSLIQEGWPLDIGGSSTSSALILDIDDNGENEVIFGDHNGELHAVVADGSEELAGFPVDLSSNINAAVAVADIDGDNDLEIAVGNADGDLSLIDHSGTPLFTYNGAGQFKANPMIADVDDNGSKEIIALTFTGNQVIVLNADGSDYGDFPVTTDSGVLSSPALADLDSDGFKEIISVTLTGDLNAISTGSAANITGFPYSMGSGSWKGPIVSNIDGDEQPEILIGTLGGDLVCINHDGSMSFERNLGTQIKTSIVPADLDDDGSLEIVCLNSNGTLYVMDNAGNDIPNFPLEFGCSTESTPLIADMDNDGNLDMVFGDGSGYLHSIGLDGYETDNFPVFLENTLKTCPAIGYADDDNDPEIVIPNQSSYILVDYKRAIGEIYWGCFKGNPARTGDYSEIVSAPQVEIADFETLLAGNYPNPFIIGAGNKNFTNIDFMLQQNTFVDLKIYNIRGQLVNTLVSEKLEKGAHRVRWNGYDTAERPVASGIYFYKLTTTENYSAMEKMILMR